MQPMYSNNNNKNKKEMQLRNFPVTFGLFKSERIDNQRTNDYVFGAFCLCFWIFCWFMLFEFVWFVFFVVSLSFIWSRKSAGYLVEQGYCIICRYACVFQTNSNAHITQPLYMRIEKVLIVWVLRIQHTIDLLVYCDGVDNTPQSPHSMIRCTVVKFSALLFIHFLE